MLTLQEQLGVDYGSTLVPLPAAVETVQDTNSKQTWPVQTVSVMPFDSTQAEEVHLACIPVKPRQTLALVEGKAEARPASTISMTARAGALSITNGNWSLTIPDSGTHSGAVPGPILGLRRGEAPWFGASALVGSHPWVRVTTTIEACGPVLVQWRIAYRWGTFHGLDVVGRWAAGTDAILITEEGLRDTDVAVEWYPLGQVKTKAWSSGGGERMGPMKPYTYPVVPDQDNTAGQHWIAALGHIGYFNQWCLCWAGFSTAPDQPGVGLFSACGGSWKRRGVMRPELYLKEGQHLLRFPVKKGTRSWGLTLAGTEADLLGDEEHRCQPNRRKTVWSDLRIAKVLSWTVDGPQEERSLQLTRFADLPAHRDRLSQDPSLVAALEDLLETAPSRHPALCAAAYWKGNRERLRESADVLLAYAEKDLSDIADGGYERLIIFDGRVIKRLCYDLDLLWTEGIVSAEEYARAQRDFLAVAHMYADPDYCIYEDFGPPLGDKDGIRNALQDEMGDTPVPPNFAAEFFTTTAVVAELFPSHPQAGEWRSWGMEQLDTFLEHFFEPDGTYLESINYHSHCFNEVLCQIWALYHKGAANYFEHARVKGSFRHFLEIQMPTVSNQITDPNEGHHGGCVHAKADSPRAVWPADGNSGDHGNEMDGRGELTLGAAVYAESDPLLSRQLMAAWQQSAKLVTDHEHPLLTLMTLEPSLLAEEVPWRSYHRQSLALVSKAEQEDGTRLYNLFRAGRATHHMDFDQGNLHLVYGDRVLLGDHGYHTKDSEGNSLPACATWLHSCITYGADRYDSCGYTGLEFAPEPERVFIGTTMDWCVHRIVNTQYRQMPNTPYWLQVQAPRTVHLRHYLFVKPHYILLWDTFEEAHGPSTWWLHPTAPMVETAPGIYQAGEGNEPNLRVHFLHDTPTTVMENKQIGPLWSFALQAETGAPYLTLLYPRKDDADVKASFDASTRTATVKSPEVDHTITLPTPGSREGLPQIIPGG